MPLADALADADDTAVFGPFRSEKDAWRAVEGKAREAGLCLKVLGLEAGPGSCFAYQVRKCRGACVGQEPRALHDARLQLAFAPLRLKPWPFRGAIGIREPAPGRRARRSTSSTAGVTSARPATRTRSRRCCAATAGVRRRQLPHHRTRLAGRAAARPAAVCVGGVA